MKSHLAVFYSHKSRKSHFKWIFRGFHSPLGIPKWMFYRENPIKMDDLGVPLFQETPIQFHCIIYPFKTQKSQFCFHNDLHTGGRQRLLIHSIGSKFHPGALRSLAYPVWIYIRLYCTYIYIYIYIYIHMVSNITYIYTDIHDDKQGICIEMYIE